MFYLIEKETGKIIEEGKSKGTLRKRIRELKKQGLYKVSKFKPGEVQLTTSGIKHVKADGSRQKGYTRRFTPDKIIAVQKETNLIRKKIGLKVIVPTPTKEKIMKTRNKVTTIDELDRLQANVSWLSSKYGIALKIGGKFVPYCLDRRELRKIRARRRNFKKLKTLDFETALAAIQ